MTAPASRWERHADSLLGAAASTILMAMMLLTVVDVVARYVFNRPLRGAFEVTELLLAVLIFAGLPLVSHANEHVTMDFIDRLLARRSRELWQRGVQLVKSAEEAATVAKNILGNTLVTIQTGEHGQKVQKVFVEEGCKILVVYWVVWRRPEFDERMDGIVYASRAGLGFALVEDSYQPEQDKRWVTIRPPGAPEHAATLLLARAATPAQAAFVGDQAGGRVFLFLATDDFDRDYAAMKAKGVAFVRPPALQPYGKVAVFLDLYGNKWDLVQFAASDR